MTGGVEIPDLVCTKRPLEEKSAESRSKRHRPAAADDVYNNNNNELDVLEVNTLSLREQVSSVFKADILDERPCAAHPTGDVVCYGMVSVHTRSKPSISHADYERSYQRSNVSNSGLWHQETYT